MMNMNIRPLSGDAATDNTADAHTVQAIQATPVPDEQRAAFWLQHFGNIPQWFRIESPIFSWLDLLCKDYHGDYWDFYTLSNGGAFISPSTEGEYTLFNALNGNSATVGHEAAGIVATDVKLAHLPM